MQMYHPPYFANTNRKKEILALLPEVDHLYKQFAIEKDLPGYAYGIVVDGELFHSGCGGYLDVDKKTPVTPRSFFRIASMTKSFTAMAILKLRDENKLRLDDPISLYIPEFKGQKLTEDSPTITIRHLLIHTIGFPTDDPWADRKMHESEEELLALLKNAPYFAHVAGTTHEYSNLGYTLLGLIVTRVSGVSYEKYILENICAPLGMKEAAWDFTEAPHEQLAQGYRKIEGEWIKEPLIRSGPFGAMGGLITSVESLAPYVALHQAAWPPRSDKETGPLKRSSLREMHHPWTFIDFVREKDSKNKKHTFTKAYGYGLRWVKSLEGLVFVGHSGGLPGFGSNWTFLPEYGIGVIFLANKTYTPAEPLNREVLTALVNKGKLKPRTFSPPSILEERQNELLKALKNWENIEESKTFAPNFFLDNPLPLLKKETEQLFEKMGSILSTEELKTESQLRGSFILNCKKGKLKILLELTPENPPRIQKYDATEIKKNCFSCLHKLLSIFRKFEKG